MDNSKYYGGRDIFGRPLPVNWQIEPEALISIDNESKYNVLTEALDGKVVTP